MYVYIRAYMQIFLIGGSWSGGLNNKVAEVFDSTEWTTLSAIDPAVIYTNDKEGVYRSDNHAWLFGWSAGTGAPLRPRRTCTQPVSIARPAMLMASARYAPTRARDVVGAQHVRRVSLPCIHVEVSFAMGPSAHALCFVIDRAGFQNACQLARPRQLLEHAACKQFLDPAAAAASLTCCVCVAVFHAGPSKQMNWFGTAGSGSRESAGMRPGEDAMNGNAVRPACARVHALECEGCLGAHDSCAT